MTSSHPHLTKLLAKVKGEVSAAELEALRGAGSRIYDSFTAVEAERKQLAAAGIDLWQPGSLDSRPRLATWWRAFACQQLGEAFLDADYGADPRTAGYVPPVTAEQVEALFTEVEVLLHDVRHAESDPSWTPAGLPSRLPQWVDVDPCPRAHLEAMFKACEVMVEHAEFAVADLEALGAGRHPAEYQRLQTELADAKADASYAADLHAGMPAQVSQNLHERIERTIKRAIENAYRIGQLAAMPQLMGVLPPAGIRRLPRPGEDGFDMWCLTDPRSRAGWRNDPAAVRAIEMLWKSDPDPGATLGIQAQIDAAVERGDLSRTSGGHYFCCPWSAVYQVVNPVTIGGKRLRRGKTLTFDVSAEEMAEGGPFTRDILSGDFRPTDKVDYCNPEEGHDDD
jgi:hypothetical protein